jgi:hypothetical protein
VGCEAGSASVVGISVSLLDAVVFATSMLVSPQRFFFMCPVVLALGQHLVEVGRDCSRLVRCGPGPSAMILVWALEPISVYRCELPIVRSRQPLNDIVDGTQLIHYEVQSRV